MLFRGTFNRILEISETCFVDNCTVKDWAKLFGPRRRVLITELERIGARDYGFPELSELDEDTAKIQAVRKSFLRKFWKVSGREIVREAARQRLEAVSVHLSFCPFAMSISYGIDMVIVNLHFLCR